MVGSRAGRWALAFVLGSAAAIVPTAVAAGVSTAAAAVSDPCGPGSNPIVCENSKAGTDPSVWDISGAGDADIQGFATQMSVNPGQPVGFKIDTDASAYDITIYRTGWYGGLGAREIAHIAPSAALPQIQPACITDPATEIYDCGNWGVSASWQVPSDAVSGIYVAKLHRADNDDSSHITFLVRNDASHSAVVMQTSDTTWQAYNYYGGSSFYVGAANGRAYKISYNRPFATRGYANGRDFYFGAEYPLVRFLEKNGYDVSYIAGADTDRSGNLLLNHKTYISVGHDEYWSGQQRANVEAARDAGVNLMFLSGNEIYWHTRWEPSQDSTASPYRTLVCYKETWANAKIDPSSEWTGTWRDPRFAPQSAGANLPENGVSGTLYMSNHGDLPVTVSAAEGKFRLWRGTGLSSLAPGASAQLAPHTVGYESDEDLDNGSRPPGIIHLSTTTGDVPQYLQDYGEVVAPGTTTHHVTMYRAASGALVFSAGSIQWTWGLDQTHDGDGAPPDSRMVQATVNVLADLGAQATTLAAGLVPAGPSTDTVAPVATITYPTPATAIPNGTMVTATGTASDVGGVVAGVELSTDGGTTWHPANGTTTWSYTYVQHGVGAETVLARAIDDSANIGAAASSSIAVQCPCSVFGAEAPAKANPADGSPLELGLRFSPTTSGFVTGVRFYKSPANGGVHTGTLWSSSGLPLATATFQAETASGWQQAMFTTAIPVTAGSTYVISYFAPNGNYDATSNAFTASPLHASPLEVAGGWGAQPAGVYHAGAGFPSSSYQDTNYFVDVVLDSVDPSPLVVTGHTPLAGSTSVLTSSTVSAVLSKPVVAESVSIVLRDAAGTSVPGTTGYLPESRTAVFTPLAALASGATFSATISAQDPKGNPVTTGATWSFTTANAPRPAGECPCSIYPETTVPSLLEVADPNPVTVGVRFASSADGVVTGVRFYKGPGNVGEHVGALWSADGTLLASATFTAESTTGWQTVSFATPVAINANTDYIASYRAPHGLYSASIGEYSGHGVVAEPLRAATDGGAYTYSTGFPGARSGTGYLVDVVFERALDPLVVTARTPGADVIGVDATAVISATFSAALVDGATVTVKAGASVVSGTSTLSPDGMTVRLTPSAPLALGTTYAVTVSGAQSLAGASAGEVTWSFTTGTEAGCPCTLIKDETPTTLSVNDPAAVELGTAFVPQQDGQVTGVRFFKGAGNGGTHTGSLWSATGTLLATVTFTAETASGWQTATFDSPVPVLAGQTYVVSYLAPQGHYSATPGFFDTALDRGVLVAPADGNGRYRYGGGLPTSSWAHTSYFVDVVFEKTDPWPPTVTVVDPAGGQVGVPLAAVVRATISRAPASGTPALALTGPGGSVAGTSSYDAATLTVAFTPSAPLAGETTFTAVVSVGATALTGGHWTFTTRAAPLPDGVCPCSLWPDSATPANEAWGDPGPVQVGVRFTSDRAGQITGVRFYKGLANTGDHTVYLWDAAGTLLASAASTGETPSGWQTVLFSGPVAITANQEYLASYYSTAGRYAVDPDGLAAAYARGPLSTLPGGGAYVYGTTFPANVVNNNYWTDVVFVPAG